MNPSGQYYMTNAPVQMAPTQPMGAGYQIISNNQQLHQQQHQMSQGQMPGAWNGDPQKPQQQQQPMRVYIGQQGAGAMPIEIQLSQSPRPPPPPPPPQQQAVLQEAQPAKPEVVHSFANRFPSASSVQQAATGGLPASQDVSDHIDSIIDAVACGSGTIPSDFAGDEEAEGGENEEDEDFFPDSNDPKSHSDTENTGMDDGGGDDDDDNGCK